MYCIRSYRTLPSRLRDTWAVNLVTVGLSTILLTVQGMPLAPAVLVCASVMAGVRLMRLTVPGSQACIRFTSEPSPDSTSPRSS